jgi:hypothetical protein
MQPKPNHIEGYVERLPNKSKYVEYEFDEYTIPYEVKCSCGNKEFIVYNNLEPRVELECTKCGNKIIVYDLDYYTCAEKYMEEELNLYISPYGDNIFNVSVVYEYSDEFSFSDENFDKNDISWCYVYVYGIKSNKVYKIVDDETA